MKTTLWTTLGWGRPPPTAVTLNAPVHLTTRNTCMQQPLAYIFQTLFQHEVFIITPQS